MVSHWDLPCLMHYTLSVVVKVYSIAGPRETSMRIAAGTEAPDSDADGQETNCPFVSSVRFV